MVKNLLKEIVEQTLCSRFLSLLLALCFAKKRTKVDIILDFLYKRRQSAKVSKNIEHLRYLKKEVHLKVILVENDLRK